jgi:hypothetical protein
MTAWSVTPTPEDLKNLIFWLSTVLAVAGVLGMVGALIDTVIEPWRAKRDEASHAAVVIRFPRRVNR